ncbi:MAG TPA: amino acid adenylation domain-containing protein, partial [Pyrinomonadaceae bacterium]|nr:amino acid adenylation domain-containing protein [Pyrinomonadaceae bacterium]
ISGRLDEPALERSLRRLLDHHEILRTAFRFQPGSDLPLQVILESPQTFALRRRDLRSTSERAQQVAQLLAEERALSFNFEHGQVFHGCLATLDDEYQLLVLSASALCADGVSLGKLGRELHKLYEMEVSSEVFAESAEVMQYADYAAWQQEVTEGADQAAGRQYWEEEEVNAAELQQKLLIERAEAPALEQEYRPEEKVVNVSGATWELLAELAHTEGVSVSEIVLASWAALIWRLSGEGSGVIIEASFDGRKYEELEEAIGNYESYLPLCCKIGADFHYRQLLKVVSEAVRGAQSRQEYFSRSRWSAMLPWQSESGSLGIGYSYEVLPESNSGTACWEAYSLQTCTERFKVKLSCVQDVAGRRLVLRYDPARLTAAAVDHLGSELATLLENAVRNPQQQLSEISLLSEAEREQVLVEWNQTTVDYGPVECVQELFEQQVERTPEATAIRLAGERLSYRELNARANQLAHHLRTLGVGPEVLVGLCLPRSLELVVAVLGILKAGGAYVPLDAEYPAERLSFMVEDAGVSLLLTESGQVEKLPVYWGQTLCLDTDWETIGRASAENLASGVSGENLAYVIYTSGSTGQPKGVMIEQRGLVNYLNWALRTYAPEAGAGALLHSSLSFDLSVTSLYVPLLTGRCLELLPATAEVDGLGETLQRGTDYTLLKVTPAHLQLLNGQLSGAEKAGASRTLVLGGENLTWEMIRSWREQAPGVRIYNEYGPTETVVGSSIYEVGEEEANSNSSGSVPIGRPIANTELYLLNEELEPVGVGVSGELYIGGAGLARAYLQRGGLTAERFIPHPYSRTEGARLYRTGDVARYLADGQLEYVGRADEQVKVRGYRIELGEVEAVLGRQWGVAECVVVARGEGGEKRLVAYVVGQAEAKLSATELRTQLSEQLPSYMVPGAFVVLDQLPLTKNGKVNKRALPDPELEPNRISYVAPRNPTEEKLAAIWCEVLGLEGIGIHDNFFELGGHSLLATQVFSRASAFFEVEFPFRLIFEAPTVAEFAVAAEEIRNSQQSRITAPAIVPIPRDKYRVSRTSSQNLVWSNEAGSNNEAAEPVSIAQS